jgi:hypothetical protein
MTDSAHGRGPHPAPGDPGGFDSEINVRSVVEVAIWLAVTTVVALVVGYFLYKGLGRWSERQDPAASPLAEANVAIAPPEPHLQANPEVELAHLRQANRDRLNAWGWVDRSAGVAHMPIEEAISRLAVPEAAPSTAAAPAAPAPAAPAAAPALEPAHSGGH